MGNLFFFTLLDSVSLSLRMEPTVRFLRANRTSSIAASWFFFFFVCLTGLRRFCVSGLSVLTRRKNCHVGLGHFARIVSFPLKGKSNNNFSVQSKIFTLWSGGTTSKFAASVCRPSHASSTDSWIDWLHDRSYAGVGYAMPWPLHEMLQALRRSFCQLRSSCNCFPLSSSQSFSDMAGSH